MTPRARIAVACAFVLIACIPSLGQAPAPGRNNLSIRGQAQDVYFFPGAGTGPHRKVLFAPGDGGWRGFAITIAEQLASAGYDVYGLDTRRYLKSMTGSLNPAQIASDFAQIARWLVQGSSERVLLVGWSEGAGLALAAGADPSSRNTYGGLVFIGMTEFNILGWRWRDVGAEIVKKLPNEPTFKSADYIMRVAPLPVFMIASTHDEYISVSATQQLFSTARDPKRLVMIEADDHKYSGKTDEFFHSLKEGLTWIQQQHG